MTFGRFRRNKNRLFYSLQIMSLFRFLNLRVGNGCRRFSRYFLSFKIKWALLVHAKPNSFFESSWFDYRFRLRRQNKGKYLQDHLKLLGKFMISWMKIESWSWITIQLSHNVLVMWFYKWNLGSFTQNLWIRLNFNKISSV